MANEAISVIHIDDKVLRQLDEFDNKLGKIEIHAKSTVELMKQGFGSVGISAGKLTSEVDRIIQAINKLGSASNNISDIGVSAQSAAKGVNTIGTSTQTTSQQISSLNTNLVQTSNLLNAMPARPFQNMNIAELQDRIKKENNMLSNQGKPRSKKDPDLGMYSVFSKTEQQEIVNRRNLMNEELKIQQTIESAQSSTIKRLADKRNADIIIQMQENEKVFNAKLSQMREEQRERERIAKLAAKTPEYANQYHNQRQAEYNQLFSAKNVSPQMALTESKYADTIGEQVAAINLLKNAKLSLSKSDEYYESKLDALNSAIKRHEDELTNAGIASKRLQGQHSKLMDISGQLQRKLALAFSVSQIQGYINKIAAVRGEFELNQRSLQAIIGNKQKADEIYGQTLNLALKSPFRAKELISFTKQLSAYRIESDKLFDTTKRLADVSAGLGVDMQRLILAYGQVKAAAYLRGTEVRQFTEAGINVYGELKRYFEEVKGEAYTTAQIVDMISKRKVTFEDIEQVFKRLTDEGGMFYNMQGIQAQTLQGKIGILNDAFDRMYNEIGKSSEGLLKGALDLLTLILRNWKAIAPVVIAIAGAIGATVLKATALKIASTQIGTVWKTNMATIKAASGVLGKFKAIMSGTLGGGLIGAGVTLAITAISNLIEKTRQAKKEQQELLRSQIENSEKLSDISYNFNNPKLEDGKSLFDYQKAQLSALQNEAENQGIHIKVELDKVTHENIKAVFNDAKNKINQIKELSDFANRRAPISDDEMEDLTKYSDRILASKQDMKVASSMLIEGYDNEIAKQKQLLISKNNLSEAQKQYIQDIITYNEAQKSVAVQAKEELKNGNLTISQLETIGSKLLAASNLKKVTYSGAGMYIDRDFDLGGTKINIAESYLKTFSDMAHGGGGDMNDIFEKLKSKIAEIFKANPELLANLQSTNEEVKRNAEETLRAILINMTSGEKWPEGGRQLAYQLWEGVLQEMGVNGFKVKLDTSEASSVALQLSKQLNDMLGDKYYTIHYGFNVIGATTEDKWQGYVTERAANKTRLQEIMDQISAAEQNPNIVDFFNLQSLKKEMEDIYRVYPELKQKSFTGSGGRHRNNSGKAERDIWGERISVLKEMQQQYEKVREHFGEELSKKMVADEFKDDLTFVNMKDVINPEDIIPTKQGLVDALNKVLEKMPNDSKFKKKRTELMKTVSDLKLQIKTDEAQKALDEVRKKVEHLFDGLDLHQKLKEIGLSESEVQALFPGISKTLDEVEREIKRMYNGMTDDKGVLSEDKKSEYKTKKEDIDKEYNDYKDNLPAEEKGSDAEKKQQEELDKKYEEYQQKLKRLQEEYYGKRNEDGELGKEEQKAYDDDILNLQKKRVTEQQNLVIELTKAYGRQLSDQLQTDIWYWDEKSKIVKMKSEAIKRIEEDNTLTDAQKGERKAQIDMTTNQMSENLEYQYKEKSDKNAFEEFKKSSMYTELFMGNLDTMSTSTLDMLKNKLEELKSSLTQLDPSNMKEISELFKKIEDAQFDNNPFKSMIDALKKISDLTKQGLTEDALQKQLIDNNQAIENAEEIARRAALMQHINDLKAEGVELNDEQNAFVTTHDNLLGKTNSKLQEIIDSQKQIIKDKKKENKTTTENLDEYSDAQADIEKLKKQFEKIKELANQATTLMKDTFALFGDEGDEIVDATADIAGSLLDAAINTILLIVQLKAAGNAAKEAMGVIGYILTALEAIVSIFAAIFKAHDAALEKQIKRLQNDIERLQRAYEDLSTAIDNAWSIESLSRYNEAMESNLRQQNQNLTAMMKAENDKKKTDKEKMQEWQDEYEDNLKKIKENAEKLIEELGGFGSDANLKSAMQEFTDAWMDAFESQENGLDALNKKWDEFIKNLVSKQAMLRVTSKFIEPLLRQLDYYLTEESIGGLNLTKEELKELQKQAAVIFPQLNDALNGLMESLDYTGAMGKTAELSGLTQNIQGVTEQTAEALESLLNSMRFFLSTQQADVAIIRNILQEQYSSIDNSMPNPMLIELQSQTGYLKALSINFESVLSYNAANKGRGIRVFMQ